MSRPDHCDGTYDANCDASRAYTNISSIISAAGQTALLNDMNTYWKDYQGDDESFWEHEWGKHGTCVSTLNPSCYTNYVPQEEVVTYFQKTVDLYKTLDSYQVCEDFLDHESRLIVATKVSLRRRDCALVHNHLYRRCYQCRSESASRC